MGKNGTVEGGSSFDDGIGNTTSEVGSCNNIQVDTVWKKMNRNRSGYIAFIYLRAESTEPTFRGGVKIRGERRSTNGEKGTVYCGQIESLIITKLLFRLFLSLVLDLAHPEALIEIQG